MPKPVLLIDGNNVITKAAFAIKESIMAGHPNKRPVGAVISFLKTIRNIAQEVDAADAFIAWDTQRSQYRQNLLSTYKAHRDQSHPKLIEARQQIPEAKRLCDMLGIRSITHPLLEADDIIAWLAYLQPPDYPIAILSNDGDLAQILAWRPNATLVSNDRRITTPTFQDTFTVPPERYLEFKALQGDSSDNIPGIPKVGPVTAREAIRESPTVADLKKWIQAKYEADKTRQQKLKLPTVIDSYLDIFHRNLDLMNLRTWEQPQPCAPPINTWAQVTLATVTTNERKTAEFADYCNYHGLPSIGKFCPEWVEAFPWLRRAPGQNYLI